MADAPEKRSQPGAEDGLKVGRRFVIPASELDWRFSASGGPGGQHANTSNTRAELIFDVASSSVLGPRQRARLLEKLGPVARVVAGDERSQAQNRRLALNRLAERLDQALRVEAPRLPTKRTYGSQQRRLTEKRERAARKRDRRGHLTDD